MPPNRKITRYSDIDKRIAELEAAIDAQDEKSMPSMLKIMHAAAEAIAEFDKTHAKGEYSQQRNAISAHYETLLQAVQADDKRINAPINKLIDFYTDVKKDLAKATMH